MADQASIAARLNARLGLGTTPEPEPPPVGRVQMCPDGCGHVVSRYVRPGRHGAHWVGNHLLNCMQRVIR